MFDAFLMDSSGSVKMSKDASISLGSFLLTCGKSRSGKFVDVWFDLLIIFNCVKLNGSLMFMMNCVLLLLKGGIFFSSKKN